MTGCPCSIDELNDLRFVNGANRLPNGLHDFSKIHGLGFSLQSESIFNQLPGVLFGRYPHGFRLGDKLGHALPLKRGDLERGRRHRSHALILSSCVTAGHLICGWIRILDGFPRRVG
jgi:hypothetical protein